MHRSAMTLVEIEHPSILLPELKLLAFLGASLGAFSARRGCWSKHRKNLSVVCLVGVAPSGSQVVRVLLTVLAIDSGCTWIEDLKEQPLG